MKLIFVVGNHTGLGSNETYFVIGNYFISGSNATCLLMAIILTQGPTKLQFTSGSQTVSGSTETPFLFLAIILS